MSDSNDRSHGPFLILLALAFLVGLIIVFGPGIFKQGAYQLSLGHARVGSFNPVDAVVNALDSFGQTIARMFAGFGR